MAKQSLTASGNVSIVKGAASALLQEYTLTNDSSQVSLQIANGTGGNLSLQIFGRIVASGQMELLHTGTEMKNAFAKNGSYPIPAGVTQIFHFAIPKCLYSLVVYAQTDGATGNCSVVGFASDL